MPLFYNKVQRANPMDKEAPKKWFPVLKSVGMMNVQEVARLIADETTLNPKEAEMALAQLEKVLINALLSGQTVSIGTWGSFQLTISADGADTEKEAGPSKIRKVNVRFQPGKALKEAVAKASFRQATDMVTGKTSPETPSAGS